MVQNFNKEDIIAGKAIAQYRLGMKRDELLQNLNSSYKTEKRENTTVIYYSHFTFFVSDKTHELFQITVGKNFTGKFLNKIGIGSTLNDVENSIGKWGEDLDVYVLPSYKGICFELKDIENFDEEWAEDKMPIEWISVYQPNE